MRKRLSQWRDKVYWILFQIFYPDFIIGKDDDAGDVSS